ncbi:MAG: Mpo1-like protein [Pseudomonadota bacterium]
MTQTTSRIIDRLLLEYGNSHQNEINKAVHWVCVPAIVWAITALLWSLPSTFGIWYINWATIFLTISLVYYIVLSPALAVGFAVCGVICVHLIIIYEASWVLPLWQFALSVFVLAWIAQFWGHQIEGKKPSFLKDVQFLMIGPAWLMSFIYRSWGIRY